MAAPMSPKVAPGRTSAMPRISASWVTSIRRSERRTGLPATNMREVSPYQPSRITVTSMFRTSPSLSFLGPGMPWQTTWLIEMHDDLV